MAFLNKLLMPKRLMIAACVMIATLILASAAEYFLRVHTGAIVRTVVYYLLLDYAWASIKREWLDGGA